jgi:phosphatidylglycerophosphatase A
VTLGSKTAALLATWFGAGLLPKAPGTWGSLAAIPFGLALSWLGGPWLLLAAAAAIFLAGIWAGGRYAEERGIADPSAVVIDEVAGQWIALAPALLNPWLIALAFLAFRVFDIVKPWPVGWLDRELKGGLGIMADDVLAGVYGAVVVWGVAEWVFN